MAAADPPRFALGSRALLVIAGVVVLLALGILAVGSRGSGGGASVVSVTGAASGVPSLEPTPGTSASARAVVVHVVGAVVAPGLYTLGDGDRVQDAIDAAGGIGADADLARLNIARVVVDGEQLVVPRVGEELPAPAGASSGGVPGGAPGGSTIVDLNTADATTLQTLPGIGPALAERILAWRTENGRFGAVDDLLEVSGIGDVRLAELRDLVRV